MYTACIYFSHCIMSVQTFIFFILHLLYPILILVSMGTSILYFCTGKLCVLKVMRDGWQVKVKLRSVNKRCVDVLVWDDGKGV